MAVLSHVTPKVVDAFSILYYHDNIRKLGYNVVIEQYIITIL